jgi:hypothetical protein
MAYATCLPPPPGSGEQAHAGLRGSTPRRVVMPADQPADGGDSDANSPDEQDYFVRYENGLGAVEVATFEGSHAVEVFSDAIEAGGGEVLAVANQPFAVEEEAFAVVNPDPMPGQETYPLTIVPRGDGRPAIWPDPETAEAKRDEYAERHDNPNLAVYHLRARPVEQDSPARDPATAATE